MSAITIMSHILCIFWVSWTHISALSVDILGYSLDTVFPWVLGMHTFHIFHMNCNGESQNWKRIMDNAIICSYFVGKGGQNRAICGIKDAHNSAF